MAVSRIRSIAELHRRHPGLTPSIAAAYAEAASVCLARHGTPPSELATWVNDYVTRVVVEWHQPSERSRKAWANEIDTTEAGAYGVALGVVETELGLVAIERARSLTGADYYIGQNVSGDGLESAYKFEVSGVNEGGSRELRKRLREKLRQVTAYGRPARAYACVVGFRALTVMVQET
jgi:hypothetical protein